MPAQATASAEEIRDVNTRYHDGAAAELRRQVGHRLRRHRPGAGARQDAQGARRRPGPLRALAGDRRGHRLLHAEPAAGGRHRPRDVHRHLPRDARDAGAQRRSGSASTSRRSPATPSACRSPTSPSTSSSATRSCTTCPTSTRPSASSAACCAPGGVLVLRRRAVAHGDRIAAVPKRGRRRGLARCGGALMRAQPAGRGHSDGGADDHGLEAFVDVHAFAPERAARLRPRAPASTTSRSAARSCWPTGSAGPTARSRRRAEPDDVAVGVAPVRLPRLPAAPARRPRAAGAAPAAGDLLQPARRRPPARPETKITHGRIAGRV